MTSPFREGQVVARLEIDGTGVRAYRTTLVEIKDGEVIDAVGRRYRADREGDFPDIVPVDDLLNEEFRKKGEGFQLVHEGKLRDPFQERPDPFDRPPPEIGGEGRGH